MKRLVLLFLFFIFITGLSLAKGFSAKPKILLLISEKNISSASVNWWASAAEFSAVETNLAKMLEDLNCSVIDTKTVNNVIKRDRSLRTADLKDKESLRLARVLRADYIVKGSAAVSMGSDIYVAASRPFFAVAAVRLIRITDGQALADLDGVGSSVNADIAAGSKEALANAATDLAAKIISNINKEGEK